MEDDDGRRTHRGRQGRRWSTRSRRASEAPSASIVTEYRGLTVAELAELRRRLAAAGRRLQDLQEHAGPPGHRRRRVPAADGVPQRADGHRPSSRATSAPWPRRCGTSPGPTRTWSSRAGWSTGRCCRSSELAALADLPPRDVLLARLAGRPGGADAASWPASSRPCPATWPTGSRPCVDQRGRRPGEAEAAAEWPLPRGRGRAEATEEAPAAEAAPPRRPSAETAAEAAEAPAPRRPAPKPPTPRLRPSRRDGEQRRRTESQTTDHQTEPDRRPRKKGRPPRWQP